jgi:hypothetical protein
MAKDNWIPATPNSVPPSGWILVREAKTGKDCWVDPKGLKESPPRSSLSEEQMDRIKRIAVALREHDSSSTDEWLTNMRRDRNPEAEIQTWEELVDVYLAELADRPSAQAEERHAVYAVLVSASMLPQDMCDSGKVMSMFPKAKSLTNLGRIVDRFRQRRFGV